MRRVLSLLAILAGLLAAGCGYHAPGADDRWAGTGGRTLYVELFANRTAEPYLDNVVTDAVARQMARTRLATLSEDRAAADLLLGGTITAFGSSAVAYDAADTISEYRADLAVRAQLIRSADGAVLWQGDLRRGETYAALADKGAQKAAESDAARIAAQRIAEDLLAHLLEDF